MQRSTLYEYQFPFARYPAVRIVLCLIAGIYIGKYLADVYLWFVFPGLITALIILEILNKITISVILAYAAKFFYLLSIIVFGAALWQVKNTGPPKEAHIWEGLSGTILEAKGVVLNDRMNESGTFSIFIDVDSINVNNSLVAFPIRLQLRAFRAGNELTDYARLNHRVHIVVEVQTMPELRNPNAFDVRAWLKREGVYGSGILIEVKESVFIDDKINWLWWRHHVHQLLEKSVGDDTIALFKAILLGEKSELDYHTRQSFSRAGLSHLMAVSGMHVGFVLMPIWMLIPWFWSWKSGKIVGLSIILGILLFYAGLTGFTASVSRASLTASLLAVGKLFQRNRDSLNTTGVAAFLLLLNNPNALYDVGFQLSFSAVTVILILGPVLREWIPKELRYSWKGNVLQFIGISVIVQLGLFPILADNFGEFSIAGPIANTAGVPITQLLFLWSMFALPLVALSDILSGWVMIPAEYLGKSLLWIVHLVGNKEFSWIQIAGLSPFIPVYWIIGIGFTGSIFIPELRYKWVILFLMVLILGKSHQIIGGWTEPVLRVTVFDVGQGDAILIETPNGKTMLYDTGVLTPFQNSGRRVLEPELRARGIRFIDKVILSHPHADHIGGIHTVLEDFDVGVIYQPPFEYHSAVFAGYMKLAEKKGVRVIELIAGVEISPDKNLKILVLHPTTEPLNRDPNAHSLSVLMVYGETRFLLTGDAESLAESQMVAKYDTLLRANWYKAGHHGSKTSSNSDFMKFVNPELIAVSLGLSNRYRHPHVEATKRMMLTGAQIDYTSLNGAIVYESDGKRIRKVEWK